MYKRCIYGNCLLVALIIWLRNPSKIKVKYYGKLSGIFSGGLHFFWLDKRNYDYYHFVPMCLDFPTIKVLLFKGFIEKFNYIERG